MSVDADDNPFRPSKDLRVEDEGSKEEKKPPTKPAGAIPTAPKSGFGFSLKTKNPVPPASKAKLDLEENLLPRSPCWLQRLKQWRLVNHRVTRTQGVIETGIPGTEITTAIETPESEIVDMMIPMTTSPPTETRATGMSETYEIHATPTAIERGTTEIRETETYGTRETFKIETTEICEIHGTPETSEIAENLSCLGDLMTGDRTHGLIPALVLDQNEGHHHHKCPRPRSS
jgi:hypothetical protein